MESLPRESEELSEEEKVEFMWDGWASRPFGASTGRELGRTGEGRGPGGGKELRKEFIEVG